MLEVRTCLMSCISVAVISQLFSSAEAGGGRMRGEKGTVQIHLALVAM